MSIVAFALLAAMLVTYALLDGYDLGVGAVLYAFGRSARERGAAIATIGPFWNGNEVWLIASGGVLFAFFPRAYAASFSGFYLPFMLVLWLLIGRGLALELRGHVDNSLWHDFWDWAFSISSALLALILGVALGNLVRGFPLDARGNFTGTFAMLLNPYALAVGAFALVVLAQHGWCFLQMNLRGENDRPYIGRGLWIASLLLCGIVTLATLATHPLDGSKLFVAAAVGVLGFVALVRVGLMQRKRKPIAAFLASSLAITALLAAAVATIFPYLIVSSSRSPGLTIFDAAPSGSTLIVIVMVVAAGLVAVYTYLFVVLRRLGAPTVDGT